MGIVGVCGLVRKAMGKGRRRVGVAGLKIPEGSQMMEGGKNRCGFLRDQFSNLVMYRLRE